MRRCPFVQFALFLALGNAEYVPPTLPDVAQCRRYANMANAATDYCTAQSEQACTDARRLWWQQAADEAEQLASFWQDLVRGQTYDDAAERQACYRCCRQALGDKLWLRGVWPPVQPWWRYQQLP